MKTTQKVTMACWKLAAVFSTAAWLWQFEFGKWIVVGAIMSTAALSTAWATWTILDSIFEAEGEDYEIGRRLAEIHRIDSKRSDK